MSRSDDQSELVKALCAARAEFQDVKKSKTADAGKYRYSYSSLDMVFDAVVPALAKHGLDLSHDVEYHEGDIEVVALLTHASGQWRESHVRLPGRGLDAQQVGSAITYGRRYSTMNILGIAPEDDDDAQSIAGKSRTRSRTPTPARAPGSPEQWLRETLAKGDVGRAVSGVFRGLQKADPASPRLGDDRFKDDRKGFYITVGRKKHDGSPGWKRADLEMDIIDRFETELEDWPHDMLEALTILYAYLPPPKDAGD